MQWNLIPLKIIFYLGSVIPINKSGWDLESASMLSSLVLSSGVPINDNLTGRKKANKQLRNVNKSQRGRIIFINFRPKIVWNQIVNHIIINLTGKFFKNILIEIKIIFSENYAPKEIPWNCFEFLTSFLAWTS